MKEKINCKKLYEEYLEAKNNTRSRTNNKNPHRNRTIIDIKDMTKRYELAKELVKHCEPFLKNKPGEFLIVQRDANV